MNRYNFTAYALKGEIDLNRVAAGLGILRKYRWEEPMVLYPEGLTLPPAVRDRGKRVYLYYFGGVVFVNCGEEEIHRFSGEMTKISEDFRDFTSLGYRERYELRVEGEGREEITNDYAIVDRYDQAFLDIICFVIAKSVALERIEERVETVLDEMENLIALLGRGKLGISDRNLSKLASSILNFKYTSIAHIMVLDKPEITWENPEADRLYLTLANLFELDQRYQEIKHKSETLLDITGVFTGLSHARRATRLEWTIILLIFIEIVIYLFEIFRK